MVLRDYSLASLNRDTAVGGHRVHNGQIKNLSHGQKTKTKLPARCSGLFAPKASTFSPHHGRRDCPIEAWALGLMAAQNPHEPEEEYTLHLGAESTPIDAMHIPAAPPPVPATPPCTRSWRSSSHAADTAAARASAYDAAGNLKITARKALYMNPCVFASPSRLPSYLPPALFSARDAIITSNPMPPSTPRSAAAAPTDRMPASSHALSSTRAMFAVARRHTARRPTSLWRPKPWPSHLPLDQRRTAPPVPPVSLSTQYVRSTVLTHPDAINAAPPLHHRAIAPASSRLARPPVRRAPCHARAMVFLSNFDFDDLILWHRHAALFHRITPPCTFLRVRSPVLTAITPARSARLHSGLALEPTTPRCAAARSPYCAGSLRKSYDEGLCFCASSVRSVYPLSGNHQADSLLYSASTAEVDLTCPTCRTRMHYLLPLLRSYLVLRAWVPSLSTGLSSHIPRARSYLVSAASFRSIISGGSVVSRAGSQFGRRGAQSVNAAGQPA
ncbi:hypothetical protein FB451DRAFT_1452318 [Mycena latifolia]|nr:hypothetical protein FB451DRAFT_1452318 [Mycena latifolia]